MVSFSVSAAVVAFLVCTSVSINISPCNQEKPKACSCNIRTRSATCNYRRLSYIPRLPTYVTKVKFVQNNFSTIDRQFFKNITLYNRIVSLNLTENLIHHITEDVFLDFHFLLSLSISNEPQLNITTLKKSFKSLNGSRLFYLQLSGHGWKELPIDMFSALTNSFHNPFNLSLTRNDFHSIDARVFSDFKNLKTLNLAWNSIKDITLKAVLSAEEVNLNMNLVRDIPSWCDPTNKTLTPNLRVLRLSENTIAEMDQSSFRCLESLVKLGLDANNFRTLKSNTFIELKSLQRLYISDNTRLKIIESFAFNMTSLQYLYFRNNHFDFTKGIGKSYSPRYLFRYCPNLSVLDMSFNKLPSRNQYSEFRDIFRPLVNLKRLKLKTVTLRSLPYDTFSRLKNLEILDLTGNLLQGWSKSDRVFGLKSSLKILSFRSNYIRVVNKTTFPPMLFKSLERLDLGDNYFSCSCDQMWFRNWIRENIEQKNEKINLTLVGYPNYYRCKIPGEMRGLSLQRYNPTEENCKEKNPLVITAISIGGFAVFAFLVIFVLYRCQTNIKNYIYLCRFYKNRKSGYIRLDSDEDYEYDVFIVYSDFDRDWVHKVCLKKLEDIEGFRVCIHHRDFDIGEPVTGNIEKYMSKCRKILVVMSNNFAESEWCQWEVDLVHERRRRQGKDVALLVMLKSIDSRHMTNRLKALLESTPHLTHCTGVGERIFWNALIKGLHKPFGHPPFAVV